ncbi:MAG: phosphoribosylformylglycinamidine cyclo-ligase [Bacteroidetes bacterium 43-93]|nr:phosphoribosylformylglycinamidine cyclo-ligase [Bacteroidota bacterium]OJX01613.1 MAG: phosphoribosylformylglycinamidine cyclo-ligase [Bacteroidetes bacterium 43-93]
MSDNNRYNQRGVSAQKEDVHRAVARLDKGLYPNAFCKIYPDYLGGDDAYCNLMHADGAGTKSILAYMYWKETGDMSVWEGIAIDSIVMNIDDLLCVGATGPFTYSSTIGRNKHLIPGDVIASLINGSQAYFDRLKQYDIDVHFLGGETADVGDVVRTVIVDGTMACRMRRDKLVTTEKMKAGDVLVSLASYGQATYEDEYNSGMGSNGLTSARHELLKKEYARKYPESVDPNLPDDVVYNGSYGLTDATDTPLNVGKMILSPTRTYAPVVLKVLQQHFDKIHGIIHCSGGGQSKCLHYLPAALRVVKNNLLPVPPLFTMIQQSAKTDWKEMYQVFNMGQRLEIFTDKETAQSIVEISKSFNIDAQISGFVENAEQKEVVIESPYGTFSYK